MQVCVRFFDRLRRIVGLFNLKAAVEREKAVQAIDVHRECKNGVVTFWVVVKQWKEIFRSVCEAVQHIVFINVIPLMQT